MPGAPAVRLRPTDVLRFALELFALFSLGFWGYLAWPFPWPGLLFLIGAPVFAAVVFASVVFLAAMVSLLAVSALLAHRSEPISRARP